MRLIATAAVLLSLAACSKHDAPGDLASRRTLAGVTTSLGAAQRPADGSPADPVDCRNDTFEFATSLLELPAGMRRVLSEGAAIADRGEDFNGTDVGRAGLPMQGFAAAAIGHDHVFAIAQEGGIVLVTTIWSFERQGSNWVGNRRWHGSEDMTLKRILSVACKQYIPRMHSKPPARKVDCTFSGSGRITLQYEIAGRRRDFELHPTNRKEWVFRREAIQDAYTDRPASATQQAELRETLQATRASMSEDDECRYVVDAFSSALNGPAS